MQKILIILFFIFISQINSFSQTGKLLLIGGGSEYSNANSWNAEAYSWAVQNASNKRVAVISMETDATHWLENYFKTSCGAVWAKEFIISSYNTANLQITYDSLITYGIIFLKGGDQWDYYNFYKNTKTHQAIEFVYNTGGVICGTSAGMAILSKVIFTAEDGTVYPDECIENPNNQYVDLANDFLPFMNGWIVDTHFAERGRMARLIAFMANWKFNNSEVIYGLGVDDMTAVAINENNIATVFGTGAANIFIANSVNTFSLSGNKLLADSVKVIQLIQGNTYNFTTGEIGGTGLTEFVEPLISEETGNYIVFASGSDVFSDNNVMIQNFYTENPINSEILIITGQSQTTANQYLTQLTNLGATNISIQSATLTNGNSDELSQKISSANKILIVGHKWTEFKVFINTSNGLLLKNKLQSNQFISAFVGDNSRFAGKIVIDNYLTAGAAYYAELTFEEGLGLLNTSAIMPNTYKIDDIYENTIVSIPYCLINNQLKFGIWLTNKNYMKYYPENSKTYIKSFGLAPAMITKFNGCNSGFSQQSSHGTGTPRMIAGFEKMTVSLIDETTPYKLGDNVSVSINYEQSDENKIQIFPIPASSNLQVNWLDNYYELTICNLSGQQLFYKNNNYSNTNIDINDFPSGIYFIKLLNIQGFNYTKKFLLIK